MDAWEDISGPHFEGEEDKAVWQNFVGQFDFSPGIYSMPAITDPSPSTTYFIGRAYSEHYTKLVDDLNMCMLAAFRRCVPADGWLYALDWRHPSYRFRPQVPFDAADKNAWRVPVLPNGDYYIFLAEDLRFGVFGHPWEQTICVFGAELLSALKDTPPLLFDTVIRENGRQIRPLVQAKFNVGSNRDQILNAIGPRGMPVTEFVQQLKLTGYEFPHGHAEFVVTFVIEDIDPVDDPS